MQSCCHYPYQSESRSVRRSVDPSIHSSMPARQLSKTPGSEETLCVFVFLSSVSQDRLLISPMIRGTLLVDLALVVLDGVFKQLSSSQVLLGAFFWLLRLLTL